jgi:hypothetical protein
MQQVSRADGRDCIGALRRVEQVTFNVANIFFQRICPTQRDHIESTRDQR